MDTSLQSANVDGTSALKQLRSVLHSLDDAAAESPDIGDLRLQSARELEASNDASYGVSDLVMTPGPLRAAEDIESHERAGASTTGLQVMVNLQGVRKVTEELVNLHKKFKATIKDNCWSSLQTDEAKVVLTYLLGEVRPVITTAYFRSKLGNRKLLISLQWCGTTGPARLCSRHDNCHYTKQKTSVLH